MTTDPPDPIAAAAARYKRDNDKALASRKELTNLVLDALREPGAKPIDIAKRAEWTPAYVRKLARDNNIQADADYKARTEKARARILAEAATQAAVPPRREQATQAARKPVPSISSKVMALPHGRVKELADRARDHHPDWVEEIQRDYPGLRGPDLDLVIVELGHKKGLKVEELSATDKPQPAVDAPRVQASAAAPAVPSAEPEASPPLPEITEKQFRKVITLAQGRATPDQRQRLTRTAKVAEQLGRDKNDEVLKAAFEMGLLTHDEVYGERPVSGEETSG